MLCDDGWLASNGISSPIHRLNGGKSLPLDQTPNYIHGRIPELECSHETQIFRLGESLPTSAFKVYDAGTTI